VGERKWKRKSTHTPGGVFILLIRIGYGLTVICKVPLPPEVPEAVIVAVPVVPPKVAVGAVVFDPVTVIMAELLELQFAATLEVKVILDPVPPFVAKLMEFPEQLLQVMVRACPTVTVAVPLKPL